MGCGKSKHANVAAGNTVVTRKKSASEDVTKVEETSSGNLSSCDVQGGNPVVVEDNVVVADAEVEKSVEGQAVEDVAAEKGIEVVSEAALETTEPAVVAEAEAEPAVVETVKEDEEVASRVEENKVSAAPLAEVTAPINEKPTEEEEAKPEIASVEAVIVADNAQSEEAAAPESK